jgi:hypothetical protein
MGVAYDLNVTGTVPLVIGGLSVLIETGGGLSWIVCGMIASIVAGVANAWVFLVEILR